MTESYKSAIKPHIPIIWISWSIIWMLLCLNIDYTVSVTVSLLSICVAVYTVLRSAFLLDFIQVAESGITVVEHYIWGWSKKNIYRWIDIVCIGFENDTGARGKKRVLLVVQIKDSKKGHYISHLQFNPREAGIILKSIHI